MVQPFTGWFRKRVDQCGKAAVNVLTLGFFVGIHHLVDLLLDWGPLHGMVYGLLVVRAVVAAAFIIVAIMLAIEIVEVFAPGIVRISILETSTADEVKAAAAARSETAVVEVEGGAE